MPRRPKLPRRVAVLGFLVTAVAALTLAVPSSPAAAQATTGWAAWTPITGTANNYATTMQLPAGGFPRATLATDSRSNVALPGGTSTYLSASTPVGAVYGTSRNQAYVNLRPKADTSTTPSTTTYTFDHPTPSGGWAFVLGDIDADKVEIRAGDAVGDAVPAATVDRWYRSSFNYAGGSDTPSWDAATSTLSGNAGALDTDGAAAWFEPDVALSSLTFVFTARSGFPIYQTWFASTAHTIGGTVADSSGPGTSCSPDGAVVRLLAPDGSTLATTSPIGGAYDFGTYAVQPGYVVTVEAPAGCAVDGPEQRGVSTVAGDATADFAVRRVVPQSVAGTVSTTDATPVAGVGITLTPPGGGTPKQTSSDADGAYLFDDNAEQAGYRVAVTDVPAGYDVSGPASRTFDIPPGSPVTGEDFTLAAQASVQGTVTGGGDGLGGVAVTITPSGGAAAITTPTGGDGGYDFPHLPAGTYDISLDPPDGYRPADDLTGVVVGTDDITGQDFALTRPGAVSGSVQDATGNGLAGVAVDVTGDVTGGGGDHPLRTDADGEYYLGDLDAGDYTIGVTPPAGYRIDGATSRATQITPAGEIRGGLDFVATRISTPTSAAPGPSSASASHTAGTVGASGSTGPPGSRGGFGSGTLADTGIGAANLVVLGLAAVVGGGLFAAGARRRRAH